MRGLTQKGPVAERFTRTDQTQQRGIAVLVDPADPGKAGTHAEDRIAALFMPLSSQYADTVAGKITHYGKYSYLAFNSGRNREKGFWPVEKSPLVHEWKQESKY